MKAINTTGKTETLAIVYTNRLIRLRAAVVGNTAQHKNRARSDYLPGLATLTRQIWHRKPCRANPTEARPFRCSKAKCLSRSEIAVCAAWAAYAVPSVTPSRPQLWRQAAASNCRHPPQLCTAPQLATGVLSFCMTAV